MCNVHIVTFTVHFYTLISCVRYRCSSWAYWCVDMAWSGDCCHEQWTEHSKPRWALHTTQTYSTHTVHDSPKPIQYGTHTTHTYKQQAVYWYSHNCLLRCVWQMQCWVTVGRNLSNVFPMLVSTHNLTHPLRYTKTILYVVYIKSERK